MTYVKGTTKHRNTLISLIKKGFDFRFSQYPALIKTEYFKAFMGGEVVHSDLGFMMKVTMRGSAYLYHKNITEGDAIIDKALEFRENHLQELIELNICAEDHIRRLPMFYGAEVQRLNKRGELNRSVIENALRNPLKCAANSDALYKLHKGFCIDHSSPGLLAYGFDLSFNAEQRDFVEEKILESHFKNISNFLDHYLIKNHPKFLLDEMLGYKSNVQPVLAYEPIVCDVCDPSLLTY